MDTKLKQHGKNSISNIYLKWKQQQPVIRFRNVSGATLKDRNARSDSTIRTKECARRQDKTKHGLSILLEADDTVFGASYHVRLIRIKGGDVILSGRERRRWCIANWSAFRNRCQHRLDRIDCPKIWILRSFVQTDLIWLLSCLNAF